jgi:hypothetical protein
VGDRVIAAIGDAIDAIVAIRPRYGRRKTPLRASTSPM